MLLMLTDEQRCVRDKIMESVGSDDGGFFFLYGYSGTGKTFIWKSLSAVVRSKGLIVLNAASSGITTLLLRGGRTLHSMLTVPIEINEASSLTMEKDSPCAIFCTYFFLFFLFNPSPTLMNRVCMKGSVKRFGFSVGALAFPCPATISGIA